MGRATVVRPLQHLEALPAKRPSLKRRRTDSDYPEDVRPIIRPKQLPVTNVREVLEQIVNDAIFTGSRCLVSRIRCYDYGESLKIDMSTNDGTPITNTLDWSVAQDVPACIFGKLAAICQAMVTLTLNSQHWLFRQSSRMRSPECPEVHQKWVSLAQCNFAWARP